jgi:predicted RecA/RadA family phage recombinase
MKNFISYGNNLDLVAPAGGVLAGRPAKTGAIISIPTNDAPAGAPFVGEVTGTWELAKVPAQAWVLGEKIYWDDTAKLCTNVVATNSYFGVASAIADNPSATGFVRHNGSFA